MTLKMKIDKFARLGQPEIVPAGPITLRTNVANVANVANKIYVFTSEYGEYEGYGSSVDYILIGSPAKFIGAREEYNRICIEENDKIKLLAGHWKTRKKMWAEIALLFF